jgi:hypothetical protein
MALKEECGKLQVILNEILVTTDELVSKANAMPAYSANELIEQSECILDDCFHGLSIFKKAAAQLEVIQSILGSQGIVVTALPSIVSKLVDASATALLTTRTIREGDRLEVAIDESIEILDRYVAVSTELIHTSIRTAKNLQIALTIATSICGASIFSMAQKISPFIDFNNRVIAVAGIPLDTESWFAIIKEISDLNEKFFGLDSDLAAAYQAQKEKQQEEAEAELRD